MFSVQIVTMSHSPQGCSRKPGNSASEFLKSLQDFCGGILTKLLGRWMMQCPLVAPYCSCELPRLGDSSDAVRPLLHVLPTTDGRLSTALSRCQLGKAQVSREQYSPAFLLCGACVGLYKTARQRRGGGHGSGCVENRCDCEETGRCRNQSSCSLALFGLPKPRLGPANAARKTSNDAGPCPVLEPATIFISAIHMCKTFKAGNCSDAVLLGAKRTEEYLCWSK